MTAYELSGTLLPDRCFDKHRSSDVLLDTPTYLRRIN